jgi:hypothetical protein
LNALTAKILEFAKGSGKAGKFLITERIITVATRVFTDVPMLGFILGDPEYGWLKSMLLVTPGYILVVVGIIVISDLFHSNGIDITGIEEMRQVANQNLERKQWAKRIIAWIMRKESLIFWVGSWFYLDPDYVTLMLRKKEDSLLKTTIKLVIPSVLISMVFWSTVYWLVYQPFKHMEWAKWLADKI